MAGRFKQGVFKPTNPEKYVGDYNKIYYRSSWEQRVFLFMDLSENVIKWFSEEICIKYISPLDDRAHRYFPDIGCVIKQKSGEIKKYLLEIKPEKDFILTKPKKMTEKSKKRMVENALTIAVNEAKWKAAIKWCNENGMEFKVISEKDLGLK